MIDDRDDEDAAPEGKGLLPKSLHKALLTGVSAVLMTEEGIRNALGDMRLPKEAIGYVVQQTERSRKDLFQAVSKEVKGFLDGADLPGALRKALTGLKVELKAEVRFVDESNVETSIHTDVKSSAATAATSAEAGPAPGGSAAAGEASGPSSVEPEARRRRRPTRR